MIGKTWKSTNIFLYLVKKYTEIFAREILILATGMRAIIAHLKLQFF